MIELAQRNGEGEDHGEAGIDGAGDEVRREDGGVPAGKYCDCEVKADDGVHGKDERGRETCEEERRGFVAHPVADGAAPAEGAEP